MKSKSFTQYLKEIYGDDIPDKVPDAVLDKFVQRSMEKANIKNLGHSVNESQTS